MKTNTIGRLTCPICNEPHQDLRVNKNGNLYMYCDNGCSIKFNPAMSRKHLPVLEQGHSIQIEKIGVITSLKSKERKEDELQWKQPRTNTGANTDGRTNGAISGVRTDNTSNSGGFLRRFLVDDDE